MYVVSDADFRDSAEQLREEHFGPVGLVVTYPADRQPDVDGVSEGNLTATIHLDSENGRDVAAAREVLPELERIAGRIVFNGWPTGVAVTHAQHHGGPFPATTAPAHTSVGSAAIRRWLVPVAYQDAPAALLPAALRD